MVGEIFVFIGENVTVEHFKNFNYGEQYRVKSIDVLSDSDSYESSGVIIFENCKWGCLHMYFDKYFVNLEKFRDNNINKIIK